MSNSLTNTKEEFIPSEGKQVKWYICGPTVYDSSHLGHARTYLSFDIIRRILEDYFGYDVQVCMNITDIDDKIIMGARKNHLYDKYVQKVTASGSLPDSELEVLVAAIADYTKSMESKKVKIEKDIESKTRTAKEAGPELTLATEKLSASQALQKRVGEVKLPLAGDEMHALLKDLKDALCEHIDAREGAALPHELLNKLTQAHSAHFEAEYLADIKALGIKTPDALTRVTEYVPEIVEMCEKIIANGFAYEAEGSVYFNVAAFDQAENHHYAKLMPTAYGNKDLLAEGEGGLSSAGSEKRSENDFALWKRSKPGEPAWPSPWGLGRPGWHIECSAMAGKVLGDQLDIHAGGCDLKFPHHDNELAQSEAYFNNDQWVNYFLHTGHLHIDGLKMSKSLKNFITIREMLETCTARQARLLFLLQSWDNNMNYQRVDTMKEVNNREKYLNEFFLCIESVLGERTLAARTSEALNEHWNERDDIYSKQIIQAQTTVHEALCDNFNTERAMLALFELVSKGNVYMEKNSQKKAFLLKKAAVFITRILRTFGVVEGAQEFGFDQAASSSASGLSERDVARPYVQALVEFRKAVRALAKEAGASAPALLKATDALRDEIMPNLDVKIADDSEFGFVFQNREELLAERRERLAAEETARKAKIQGKLSALQTELKKLLDGKDTPKEAVERKHFVSIDSADAALPENDSRGEKISGSAGKNIKKTWAAQAKLHEAYQKKIAASPQAVEELEAKIADFTAQLKL